MNLKATPGLLKEAMHYTGIEISPVLSCIILDTVNSLNKMGDKYGLTEIAILTRRYDFDISVSSRRKTDMNKRNYLIYRRKKFNPHHPHV